MIEERDVVIVGGGIAGLVAAHRLRDHEPVVLEATDRVGGRIWSKQRGDLALSVGAHMFPPPDSVIGQLVTELGLDVMPITGSMLNIHLRRPDRAGHPAGAAALPPAAVAGRPHLVRACRPEGQARRRRVHEAPPAPARRHRRRPSGCAHCSIDGDETFAEFLGRLQPGCVPHLRGAREPLDRRSGRDLAVRDGGALRPRLGQRRSRPQHARRLGPATGRARPRARPDRPSRPSRGLAAPGRGGRTRHATRVRTEQARSARAPRSPRYPPRTFRVCSATPCRRTSAPRSGTSRSGRWSC